MFLPISREDVKNRGWKQVDFVIVTGDAYVDHHSFGTAIISRLLEKYGYKVAVLARPDFHSAEDFKRFGKPRLGFLINGGVVDSMVNNYSVFKKKRRVDEYAPGGKFGGRPDRAVIVYANRAREAYKDVPVVIGGIEASLRRFAHYDYWDDKVRRSILLDSKADLLIYGMGERAIIEVAQALEAGINAKDISWIKGTCYLGKDIENYNIVQVCEIDSASKKNNDISCNMNYNESRLDAIMLADYDEVKNSKRAYASSFKLQNENNDYITAKTLIEKYSDTVYVIQNPPQEPLNTEELDDIYELDYENEYHPIYEQYGGVPAFKEVKFSLVSNRGCFGNCSFCAITYHQGRQVRARSKESLIKEAKALTLKSDFKGYIHDVGGPTANFTGPACSKQLEHGVCKHKQCLYPTVCDKMNLDHGKYLDILTSLRNIKGVKKVFIRSGIRYDYLLADKKNFKLFMRDLVRYHVSGILKVAPEHTSGKVLSYMGKPDISVFTEFDRVYREMNEEYGLKQYLIPYLISSHPGSTLSDAVDMALFLKKYGFVPDQVQDFYPTPGTLSTCMFYTGIDPMTMREIYVPKDIKEKRMQRALIHYNKPENYKMVISALKEIDREDLIPILLQSRGDSRIEYGKRDRNNFKRSRRHDKRDRCKSVSGNKRR